MNNEKLQRWALFAEIVGGVAVLVSIAVLVVQIRDNTNAIRAQTFQAIQSEFREAFEFPENYLEVRFDKDPSEYTLVDDTLMRTFFSRIMRIYENQWYQYSQGLFDEQLFRGYQQHMRITLGGEYFRNLWDLRKELGFFHPDFVQYVDELLLENPTLSVEDISVNEIGN